jgi:hypothetical protein
MKISVISLTLTLTAALPLAAFEEPRIFNASEIIPAYLVAGPHHRVRDLAQGDGYLIEFVIDSDYGIYECVGTGELQRRVDEIRAISTLVAVSKSDLFAEGVKKSIASPLNAVKNIVEDPGGAVKQVPKSVGHFFGKVGSGIGNAARKAGEKKNDSSPPDAKEVGKGLGKAIKNVAGFDKAKLECARQLGIDPYTDNARLQEEMEKVTWAFFAGGLPLKIGVSVASSGASRALSATEFVGLPDDIYQLTASEIDFRDRQILNDLGIGTERIDTLFANPYLTLSLRHSMVGMIAKFSGSGRGDLVSLMEECDSVWRGHFLADTFHLLHTRQQSQAYASFGVYGRLAVALTSDGILEIPAPVDYISWTEPVAEFATRQDIASVEKRRLILQGNLSPETKRQLDATGWEVIRLPR